MFAPLKPEWLGDDEPFSTPERAARYLALLQALESDLPPQPEFVRALLDCDLPADPLGVLPPRFFKAAWKRYTLAELHGDVGEVLTAEIIPLARWFINEACAVHDKHNLLKAGWASLFRGCAQAHEEATWAVVGSIEEAVARDPELAARIDEVRRRQPKDSQFSCQLDL